MDFKGNLEETVTFEKEILDRANAREIFLFAKYVKNANIDILLDKILELNDKEYIHYFLYSIKLKNYDKIIEKIITFNDPSLLYYAFYNTKTLNQNNILSLLKALIKTENTHYIFLFLYYYFNILKLKNKEVEQIARNLIRKEEIVDITEYLELIKEKHETKKSKEYNYYSENRYNGRKGIIPDVIVCHITKDYYKAINTLYDETKEVSSHFIINVDGEVKQIVSLNDSAWANGTNSRPESDLYYKFATSKIVKNRNVNANLYTFSIEHISFDGTLTKKQYISTIKVFKKIIDFVKKEYNLDFIIDREHIIGHNEVNPIVRPNDPGEKYPFEEIIKDLRREYKK